MKKLGFIIIASIMAVFMLLAFNTFAKKDGPKKSGLGVEME